ncbi:MAG: hypothetical protein ISS10_00430 [Candidatus Marinimicrobia bacterium]|nr:hypothetical protein [Candidatus Neomarinimicrobiota bacterium]MBL7059446.1 hypothetical protein [Candidatus Neomarinimicrobiota bacterium]
MIAYLSGAMEKAVDEGADWRKEITLWLKSELNHDVVDPVVESKKLVKLTGSQDYRKWKEDDPGRYISFVRKCVKRDLDVVMKEVNYLICLWDEFVLKGGGTHGEVTVAYLHHVPVYLVNRLPKEDFSSWIEACSTKVFQDFSSLQQFLKEQHRKGQNIKS